MDYLEILSFCAFDIDRADEMIKEMESRVETIPCSKQTRPPIVTRPANKP